jgi:hypothetical protein
MKLTSATLLLSLFSVAHLTAQEPATLSIGIDHLILATGQLPSGIEEFTRRTGVVPRFGGQHPGRRTQNALVSLGSGVYLELLAPIVSTGDSGTGQLTPAGWAMHTPDLAGVMQELQTAGIPVAGPVPGSRLTPDSTLLRWRTASIGGPGLELAPFLIEWAPGTPHPSSTSPAGCSLAGFELVVPDTTRLHEFFAALGARVPLRSGPARQLSITLACPRGMVHFDSPPP